MSGIFNPWEIFGPDNPETIGEMGIKQENGKFWKRDKYGNVSQIDVKEYSQIEAAKDTGPFQTAMVNTGDVMKNAAENIGEGGLWLAKKAGVVPEDLEYGWKPEYQMEPGAMQALNNENPYSAIAGQILPYLATGPLYSGGLVSQGAVGAATGLGFAEDPGAEDAIIGGLGGVGGGMLDRVLGKMWAFSQRPGASTSVRENFVEAGGRLSKDQMTKGREGWRDVVADKLPVRGSTAEGMGTQNQIALNKAASKQGAGMNNTGDTVPVANVKQALDGEKVMIKQLDHRLSQMQKRLESRGMGMTPEESQTFYGQYNALEELKSSAMKKQALLDMVDKNGNVIPGKVPMGSGDPIMDAVADTLLKPRVGPQGTIEPMWSQVADLMLTGPEIASRGASNWLRGQGPKASGTYGQEAGQGLLQGLLADVDEDYRLYGYGTGDALIDSLSGVGSYTGEKVKQAGGLLGETAMQVYDRW